MENRVDSNSPEDSPDVFGHPFPNNITAPTVVDKDAPFYKMDHQNRGIALIFNHENFKTKSRRLGAKADQANLEETFRNLEFDVRTYNDLKVEELHSIIRQVSEEDHSDNDCLVMCVLTHGDKNILHANDWAYTPNDLWEPFTADKCRTLAGKPKMFFIQACQGSQLDCGITMQTGPTETDSPSSYKLPVYADFLIAYSTIPGFSSWRNEDNGSWFVQALCAELRENAFEFDLLTILSFVNRRVATEFESKPSSKVRRMVPKKQIPFITFMLTRLIKFPKVSERS